MVEKRRQSGQKRSDLLNKSGSDRFFSGKCEKSGKALFCNGLQMRKIKFDKNRHKPQNPRIV